MPCYARTIVAVVRINMKNVDIEALREALKLMYPQGEISIVRDYGRRSLTLRFNGRVTTVDLDELGLKLTGEQGDRIRDNIEQFYAAVVRALAMRADGLRTDVQVVGDKIRIVARG